MSSTAVQELISAIVVLLGVLAFSAAFHHYLRSTIKEAVREVLKEGKDDE